MTPLVAASKGWGGDALGHVKLVVVSVIVFVLLTIAVWLFRFVWKLVKRIFGKNDQD